MTPTNWRRFFPHLRDVSDDQDDACSTFSNESDSSVEEINSHIINKKDNNENDNSKALNDVKKAQIEYHVTSDDEELSGPEDDNHADVNNKHLELKEGMPYELRDEAHRSKWNFFYEYEYRFNKQYRKGRRWYEFLYPNHATQTKAERTLLYKLDIIVALYFFVVNWTRSIDGANYSNAYVSNMKEDLHMTGNDYVYTSTITTVGQIVFQIPFMYILPRFSPHCVLPIMDLGWSFFTFACYRAKTLRELQGYRFILGAFGSAYYPVSQYIFGAWYAPDEICSRVLLFTYGQLLGTITSGLLQAAIFKNLNGVCGLAGWRWMFLIDGIAISLPVGILGFFVLPGVPSKCYSLFLSDEEIRIARRRNRRNNIHDGVDKSKLLPLYNLGLWKKVIFKPSFWILAIFDMLSWNVMTIYTGSYQMWLKSNPNYSIEKVNNLSTLPPCLAFIYVTISSLGADLFRSKWVFMVFSQIMNCVSTGILMKWDVPVKAKWFAFLISYYCIGASSCLWSYINDFLRFDPQVRAVSWITNYMLSQAMHAWIPTVAWRTVEAPRFKTGYTVALVFSAIYGAWTFVVLFFYKHNEKNHALENGIILYDSSKGQEPPSFVSEHMVERDGYYYVK
ncbi:Vitamin H transporter [Nakaseomyces bracarensis]|uniref:Vitamin H transporter n=1 Tax=Nakaseomyces bracarensis TaxID=273131 RepID=A0ABR4NNN4_9SACH